MKQTWICQQITTRQEYYCCVDIASNCSIPLFNQFSTYSFSCSTNSAYNVHAHAVAMWRSQLETQGTCVSCIPFSIWFKTLKIHHLLHVTAKLLQKLINFNGLRIYIYIYPTPTVWIHSDLDGSPNFLVSHPVFYCMHLNKWWNLYCTT